MGPPLRCIWRPSLFFVGAGHWPARRYMRRVQEAAPYSPAPAVICSAKPGAEVEPHQRQFLQTQGPVARRELRKATQILRAGRTLPTQRDNPRKWGPGKAVLWAQSAHRPRPRWRFSEFFPYLPAKPSAAGSPGRGGARERAQFSPSGGNGDKRTLRRRAAMGKVTRRPQAAKLPANNGTHSETCPLICPLRGHLPPRGKAFQEDLFEHTHYRRARRGFDRRGRGLILLCTKASTNTRGSFSKLSLVFLMNLY